MRSGDLDTLVRFYASSGLVRSGRSRVSEGEQMVAERLARYEPALGNESMKADRDLAVAPAGFVVRREPAIEAVVPGNVIALVEDGQEVERFTIGAKRAWPLDPRHAIEFVAVAESIEVPGAGDGEG